MASPDQLRPRRRATVSVDVGGVLSVAGRHSDFVRRFPTSAYAPNAQYWLGNAYYMQRDYKNVHTDVRQLADLGLIERQEDGRVRVPWRAVRAELRLP